MTNEQASSCTSARVHLSNRQEGDIYFKNMTEGEEQYHTCSRTGQSSGKPVADTQHLRAWCPQMHKHKEHPYPPGEETGTQLTSLGCCQWRVCVAEKGRSPPLRHFTPHSSGFSMLTIKYTPPTERLLWAGLGHHTYELIAAVVTPTSWVCQHFIGVVRGSWGPSLPKGCLVVNAGWGRECHFLWW